MAWQEPKTIWTPDDPITEADLARMEGNTKELKDTKLDKSGGEVTGTIILPNGVQIRGKKTDETDLNLAYISAENEGVFGSTLLQMFLHSLGNPKWRSDPSQPGYDFWTDYNIPTGSISTGDYIRFPNGWQICYKQLRLSYGSPSYLTETWTLPAGFVNTSYIVPNPGLVSLNGSGVPGYSQMSGFRLTKATTKVDVYLYRAMGQTDFASGHSADVVIFAVGKYK